MLPEFGPIAAHVREKVKTRWPGEKNAGRRWQLVSRMRSAARSGCTACEVLRLSQERLAKVLRSSQSRVAKMEAADPSVSMDLLMHALVTLGVRREALARIIGVRRMEDVNHVPIRPRLPHAAEAR